MLKIKDSVDLKELEKFGFELNENEELKIKLQLINLHKKEDINEMANIIIETRKELLEYKKRIDKAIEYIEKAMIKSDITGNGTLNINKVLSILRGGK